jgi:hypothetical protein
MKRILVNAVICCCVVAIGCKKKFDEPPYRPANDGARLLIGQLKSRVADSAMAYRFFEGDTNLYCTVTADELSGNIYKQVFVRDEAGGAIQLNLVNSGGLYAGDKIRINLNKLNIVASNQMIYLDSVDVEKNVVKLSSGNPVLPKVVTLNAVIAQLDPTQAGSLQSQLVEINGVEFIAAGRGKPFGDVTGKAANSYNIKNCSGSEAIVRTSGFANFAGKLTPEGNGKIIALVTQYKNDIQLVIRNYSEVQMNGTNCIPTPTITGKIYHLKDFNDNSLTSGGWSVSTVTNSSVKWSVITYSGTPTPFAKISGFVGSANAEAECWLISPSLTIAGAANPVLIFQTAAKYSGTPLEVMVSSSYTGGAVSAATWTSLAPGYSLSPSTGNYNWTSSGNISLQAYKNMSPRIAFKYKSTALAATTYELDEIAVKEN